MSKTPVSSLVSLMNQPSHAILVVDEDHSFDDAWNNAKPSKVPVSEFVCKKSGKTYTFVDTPSNTIREALLALDSGKLGGQKALDSLTIAHFELNRLNGLSKDSPQSSNRQDLQNLLFLYSDYYFKIIKQVDGGRLIAKHAYLKKQMFKDHGMIESQFIPKNAGSHRRKKYTFIDTPEKYITRALTAIDRIELTGEEIVECFTFAHFELNRLNGLSHYSSYLNITDLCNRQGLQNLLLHYSCSKKLKAKVEEFEGGRLIKRFAGLCIQMNDDHLGLSETKSTIHESQIMCKL